MGEWIHEVAHEDVLLLKFDPMTLFVCTRPYADEEHKEIVHTTGREHTDVFW